MRNLAITQTHYRSWTRPRFWAVAWRRPGAADDRTASYGETS